MGDIRVMLFMALRNHDFIMDDLPSQQDEVLCTCILNEYTNVLWLSVFQYADVWWTHLWGDLGSTYIGKQWRIYIYIYMCVCVCVCVYVYKGLDMTICRWRLEEIKSIFS